MAGWEWLSGVIRHKTKRRHLLILLLPPCHFIVNTSRVHVTRTVFTIQKYVWSIYTIHNYTCVLYTWYCIVKMSKAVNGWCQLWRFVCAVVLCRDNFVLLCVVCLCVCGTHCVLLCSVGTIGWNASNLSTAHREDTPDTLLVNVESIFSLTSFLHVSLHIWFHLFVNSKPQTSQIFKDIFRHPFICWPRKSLVSPSACRARIWLGLFGQNKVVFPSERKKISAAYPL